MSENEKKNRRYHPHSKTMENTSETQRKLKWNNCILDKTGTRLKQVVKKWTRQNVLLSRYLCHALCLEWGAWQVNFFFLDSQDANAYSNNKSNTLYYILRYFPLCQTFWIFRVHQSVGSFMPSKKNYQRYTVLSSVTVCSSPFYIRMSSFRVLSLLDQILQTRPDGNRSEKVTFEKNKIEVFVPKRAILFRLPFSYLCRSR